MSEHTYCDKCGTFMFIAEPDEDGNVYCDGCRENMEGDDEENSL